jgi:hypothetical protein
MAHGVYYVITGIWPLLSMYTFMCVTGYKVDEWLVNQVGLLAFAVGAGLLYSAITNKFEKSLLCVVILSCLAFMAIDIYYAVNNRISKIYLADAVAEAFFVSCHLWRMVRSF